MSPAELAALVNDYYQAIFRVVQKYGGEISDTAGDSMIAVWASSRPDAAARLRAAQAALAILDAVEEFNRAHADSPLPTRVGLESGEMLLGNIGAEQRYEYRAVGDIVNTASRIQGLNQMLGTRVLFRRRRSRDVELAGARRRHVSAARQAASRARARADGGEPGVVSTSEGLAAFAAALAAFRRGDVAGGARGIRRARARVSPATARAVTTRR